MTTRNRSDEDKAKVRKAMLEGDYTGALVAGLERARGEVQGFGSPAPADTPSPAPLRPKGTQTLPDAAQDAPLGPGRGALFFVLAAVVLGLAFWLLRPAARSARRERGSLKRQLEAELGTAGTRLVALSGLGDLPELTPDPDDHATFALVSGLLDGQRGELKKDLRERYAGFCRTFDEAGTSFETLSQGARRLGREELSAWLGEAQTLNAALLNVEAFAHELEAVFQKLNRESGSRDERENAVRGRLERFLGWGRLFVGRRGRLVEWVVVRCGEGSAGINLPARRVRRTT